MAPLRDDGVKIKSWEWESGPQDETAGKEEEKEEEENKERRKKNR